MEKLLQLAGFPRQDFFYQLTRSWTTSLRTPLRKVNMYSNAGRRCGRALLSSQPTAQPLQFSLPSFLVPAFQPAPQSSQFSTSTQCQSKVGRAPISLPPEVNFTITEPPPQKQASRVGRAQAGSIVQVEGPLGRMSMTIPPYMQIESDEATRSKTLSILDAEDRKQRQMWGMSSSHRLV